jgi:hypothetical protein
MRTSPERALNRRQANQYFVNPKSTTFNGLGTATFAGASPGVISGT